MWKSITQTFGINRKESTPSIITSSDLSILPLPPHEPSDKELLVSTRFQTQQQCRAYINCFCRGDLEGFPQPSGYAVNIRRTLPSNTRVDYVCDRARLPRQDINATKRRSSKKIGCPFAMQARRAPDGLYDLYITNQYHNHSRSTDLEVHSALRRPTDAELTDTLKDVITKATPKQAQEAVKTATNCPITKQDIYNLKRKFDKINNL